MRAGPSTHLRLLLPLVARQNECANHDHQKLKESKLSDNGYDWQQIFATRASRICASEIRELLKILDQPGMISFAGGIPDPALFPVDAISAAYERLFSDPTRARQALQYSISEGYLPLRENIARYMATLGVTCHADNILITNGSQQGLDFIGKIFISPKDSVLVAAPTYLGALQAFNAYESSYATLDMNDLRAEKYRQDGARAGGRLKFAYIVSDFANPSGQTLTRQSRESLLKLTDELDIPLVEDAAYSELRYDGERVPAIQAIDTAGRPIDQCRTIYCGTFSKTYAPSLRIGWICASRPLISKLVLVKQGSDLINSTINQIVMNELLLAGMQERVNVICPVYRQRRDRMLQMLKAKMPPGVTWTTPEGGMFIWVTLPKELDGAQLLQTALREARVAFVPGSSFYANEKVRNTMRLSFSLATDAEIDDGVTRLANIIKAASSTGN